MTSRTSSWHGPCTEGARRTVAARATALRLGRALAVEKPWLSERGGLAMRSILLWLLGIPIPIIILIGLFSHF